MLDKDMREPLFFYLESNCGKIRIFEEKNINKARADAIAITDKITGYEIKSDGDTYIRLNKQVKYYDNFCDENYIVVGKTHLKSVEQHVPKYWGIICIHEELGNPKTDLIKKAEPNPKAKLKRQMSFLWKESLFSVLKLNNMPKYRNKSKKFIVDKLVEKVDNILLKQQVLDELFELDYTIFL